MQSHIHGFSLVSTRPPGNEECGNRHVLDFSDPNDVSQVRASDVA